MFPLLRCIGEALVQKGLPGLLGEVPFVGLLFEVAADTHERWRRQADEAARRAELLLLIQASPAEVRREADAIASDLLLEPGQAREAVVGYLSQVPAAVRRTFRRPEEPAGRTLPPGLRLKDAHELLRLLPARPPRFRPGDRPLGGVWELEELLGVGGFGEVWKARHPYLRNIPPVALKFCLDADAAGSLRREAALLDHVLGSGGGPGVVALRNAYLDADPVCLEYELVEGGDLASLAAGWPAGERVARSTDAAARLAQVMGRMHRLSPPLVHRDLKPANVLVKDRDGRAEFVIADFGISGLAAEHEVRADRQGTTRPADLVATVMRGAYTPLYASPQQRQGRPPDPRDDVYSLGVIWYQLALGDLGKRVGPDYAEDLRELGMADEHIRLLGACVAEKADRRPADAAALAELLAAAPPPEVVVAVDGTGHHRSITAAIRSSPPGGRVRVLAGVYRECVVIDRPLTLTGEGEAAIECADGTALTLRAPTASVTGLTVRRLPGGRGHALDVAGGCPTLEGCTFTSASMTAVEVRGDARPTFRSCHILDGKDGGLTVCERAAGTFLDCRVTGHAGAGVTLRTEGEPTFERCLIAGNGQSGVSMTGGRSSFDGCDVADNGRLGLTASGGAKPAVRACRFERNGQGGVWLHGEAAGRFERCEFAANGRSAINLSTGADPLFVACLLKGGTAGGLFVFDAGRGVLEGCEISGHTLANVETRDGGNPTLRGCTVHGGKASGVNAHSGGRGTLERCDVHGHASSNVVVKSNAVLRLRGCKARDGKASGVFVLEGGEAAMEGCEVAGNALAGVEARERGKAVLRGCTLRDGLTSGAFANAEGRVTLEDCELTRNHSAGVVACERGEVRAVGCAVRENLANGVFLYRGGRGSFTRCAVTANAKAGFEVREEAAAEAVGCRVTDNGYEGLWLHAGGSATVEGSDLSGNRRGAWDVSPGCKLVQSDNRE